MSDLKRIEPIEECLVRACDGPLMFTLKNALLLGKELARLAVGAVTIGRQD